MLLGLQNLTDLPTLSLTVFFCQCSARRLQHWYTAQCRIASLFNCSFLQISQTQSWHALNLAGPPFLSVRACPLCLTPPRFVHSRSSEICPERLKQSMRNHDIIHEIPFMHCFCLGMHLDDALLIALDVEHMHCRLFSIACDDPTIADPYVGLINIFDLSNDGLFIVKASHVPNPCKIFTLLPEQCPKDGDPIIVPDIDTFWTYWNLDAENMLTDMDWRGVVAMGGSILACLSLPHAVCGSNSEIRHFQWEHFSTLDRPFPIWNVCWRGGDQNHSCLWNNQGVSSLWDGVHMHQEHYLNPQ